MAWSSSLVAQQRGNECGRARVEGVAVEVAVVVEVGAELRGVALVVGQALDHAVARTDDRRVAKVTDTVGVGVAEAVGTAAADAQSTALRVGIARRRGYAGTGWTGRGWTGRGRASRIRASRTSRYCGWSCQQSFFFVHQSSRMASGQDHFPIDYSNQLTCSGSNTGAGDRPASVYGRGDSCRRRSSERSAGEILCAGHGRLQHQRFSIYPEDKFQT